MALTIWEVFIALLRRGEEGDDEEDRGRFVPSPLDLSVRAAHGGRDDETVRELERISDQARELERNQ